MNILIRKPVYISSVLKKCLVMFCCECQNLILSVWSWAGLRRAGLDHQPLQSQVRPMCRFYINVIVTIENLSRGVHGFTAGLADGPPVCKVLFLYLFPLLNFINKFWRLFPPPLPLFKILCTHLNLMKTCFS